MSNVQAIHSYKLNTENAKQVGVSSVIKERGAYKGKLTRAEAVTSVAGTQGIEFSFRSDDGQSSDYLTVWTVNGEGKELYGRKILDAMMTSMRVSEIAAEEATIAKRDATGVEKPTRAIIFPRLMHKPIGLLLVREEYAKADGHPAWKMVIVGAFEHASNKLPREVLENKSAELLERVVPLLVDRPLKQRNSGVANGNSGRGSATTGAPRSSASSRPADPFGDMDDDIPF